MKITFDIKGEGLVIFRVAMQGVLHEVRATEHNDPFTVLGLSAIEVSVGAAVSTAEFISEPDGHILKLRAAPDGMLQCELIWTDDLIVADGSRRTRTVGKDQIYPYDYAKMVLDILLDVKDQLDYDEYESIMLHCCHYPRAILQRLYANLGIKWWEYDKERKKANTVSVDNCPDVRRARNTIFHCTARPLGVDLPL